MRVLVLSLLLVLCAAIVFWLKPNHSDRRMSHVSDVYQILGKTEKESIERFLAHVERWYTLETEASYLELLKRVYRLKRVTLKSGRKAWEMR